MLANQITIRNCGTAPLGNISVFANNAPVKIRASGGAYAYIYDTPILENSSQVLTVDFGGLSGPLDVDVIAKGASDRYMFTVSTNTTPATPSANNTTTPAETLPPPTVTLSAPVNGVSFVAATVTFTCSASNAARISLYTNTGGTWQWQHESISASLSYTTALMNGTYEWNCIASNGDADAWHPQNYTFTFRTPVPSQAPPPPPLQCGTGFARADGSCTVYGHIKLFNYALSYFPTSAPDVWKAQHSDLAFFHTAYRPAGKAANPNIKTMTYRNMGAINNNEAVIDVPAYCATHGCDPENFYYHYKTDVYNLMSTTNGPINVAGYNPGDPLASATSINQSRMINWWSVYWYDPNVDNNEWADYNLDITKSKIDPAPQADAVFLDGAQFVPMFAEGVDKTAEYWNVPADNNHPLVAKYFQRADELQSRLDSTYGRHIEVLRNAQARAWYHSSLFNWYYSTGQKSILLENWMTFNTGTGSTTPYYETDNAKNNDLLAHAKQGQKFYLVGRVDAQPPDDRAKMFLLSAFYLINHENMYFMFYDQYLVPGHDINKNSVTSFEQFSWIPAVTYDVGQPLGDNYEWATGTETGTGRTYHIIARDYTNALVLVKWRPQNSALTPATTHQLGGTYRPLLADGTLGAPITQVTLRNNEGAILVK